MRPITDTRGRPRPARARPLCAVAAALLLAPLLIAGCGGDGGQSDGGQHYVAELCPVNDSGVRGRAELTRDGEHLVVHITASGLTRNRIHEMHIHGFSPDTSGRQARCPRGDGADGDDDLLRNAEAIRRYYGEVILPILPYPTVREDGRIDYDLTLSLEDYANPEPLGDRVVDIHGMSVRRAGGNRVYAPTVPVACGSLQRAQEE